jgi:hypothetical protein
MADVLITDAPQVASMAAEIIKTEDEFARLRHFHLVTIFRDTAQKKGGKVVYGTAEVVRGKNAHLYWSAQGKNVNTAFYRITIAADLWELLDDAQRFWLIRHELRHCGIKVSEKGVRLTLIPHDFELFFADIKDPVMDSVCAVIQAAKEVQGKLDMDE